MTSPTPFTVLPGADDMACVDGVCAMPAPSDVAPQPDAADATDAD